MQKLILVVLLGFFPLSLSAKNLVLVEFNTQDYESTLLLLSEIEAMGATARHIFAPNSAILDRHELTVEFLQGGQTKYKLYTYEQLLTKTGLVNESVRAAFCIYVSPKKKW